MMLEFTVGINIDGKRESVTVAAEVPGRLPQVECLRGLAVDGQLDFSGLPDRQVKRLPGLYTRSQASG